MLPRGGVFGAQDAGARLGPSEEGSRDIINHAAVGLDHLLRPSRPGEDLEDAVRRRGEYELGLPLDHVELTVRDFRYRAVDASGVVENEICPVFTARAASPLAPRADEVVEWQWTDPPLITAAVAATPWAFSPWLTHQLPLLYPDRFSPQQARNALPVCERRA
jgi:isopentenyldiphosphate isomerase